MAKPFSGVKRRLQIFVLIGLLAWLPVPPAGAGAVPVSSPLAAVPGDNRLAGGVDLKLIAVLPVQTIEGEPLVLGKSTAVRLLVGSDASSGSPIEAEGTARVEGKTYTGRGKLTASQDYVDVSVDPPSQLKTLTIEGRVEPVGGREANPDDNSATVRVPTVDTGDAHIHLFFLPIDYTDEVKREVEFDRVFPAWVKDQTDFMRAIYPLPDDRLTSNYTLTPHVPNALERTLADSRKGANQNAITALYSTVFLAARRLDPETTIAVAVLPPRWLTYNYNPRAAGFSAFNVRVTVSGQIGPILDVTAHEVAHTTDISDDYDYSPGRTFDGFVIDRPGFWVSRGQEMLPKMKGEGVLSFMGSGNPGFVWIDTRSYDHLLAHYTLGGNGRASEPLVLGAIMSNTARPDGSPGLFGAGTYFFAPDQDVVCIVAGASLNKSDAVEVRWLRGNSQVATDQARAAGGNQYLPFSQKFSKTGDYTVEVYLNGQLAKTAHFTVRSE